MLLELTINSLTSDLPHFHFQNATCERYSAWCSCNRALPQTLYNRVSLGCIPGSRPDLSEASSPDPFDDVLPAPTVSFASPSSPSYLRSFNLAHPQEASQDHRYPRSSSSSLNFSSLLIVGSVNRLSKKGFRPPDPLAAVMVDNSQLFTTSVIRRTLSPSWDEGFVA